MNKLYTIVISVLCAAVLLPAQQKNRVGTLTGVVADTKGRPLQGAAVRVLGTTRGAVVKANGTFTVTNIPLGSYSIKVSLLGFKGKQGAIRLDEAKPYEVVQFALDTESIRYSYCCCCCCGCNETKEDTVAEIPTPKEVQSLTITLAPNPAIYYTQVLYVLNEAADVSIQVFRAESNQCLINEQRKNVAAGAQEMMLDVSALERGSYIVLLRTSVGEFRSAMLSIP